MFKDHNLKGPNFNTLPLTYSKAFMLESMKHANLPGVASLQPAQTKAQNRKSHATRFPLSTVEKNCYLIYLTCWTQMITKLFARGSIFMLISCEKNCPKIVAVSKY